MKIITATCVACFMLTSAPQAPAGHSPIPEGRRLRSIVEGSYQEGTFYIGGTIGWRDIPPHPALEIINREFNYACPANSYKQTIIHPRPGVWQWRRSDAWVEFCKKAKQVMRLHGPISPQTSPWARDDHRTAEELTQNLIEYMTALCKRYDKYSHVKWMDVVNETVSVNGHWFGPQRGIAKWENPWPLIGFDETHPLRPPLYIKLAFEIATKHAPNTKLIINQHGGMEIAMWEKVKALVPYLREQGLRVDGIGWQAHISTGFERISGNMARLHQLIAWAHNNALSFHVTEMTVRINKEEKTEDDDDAQAATFAAILSAVLEHREQGEVTVNLWSIAEATDSKYTQGPFVNLKAKPAYYAIQEVLEHPPKPR